MLNANTHTCVLNANTHTCMLNANTYADMHANNHMCACTPPTLLQDVLLRLVTKKVPPPPLTSAICTPAPPWLRRR